MVAVVLMNSSEKKKLETGRQKSIPPFKIGGGQDGAPKRKRGSARVYEELREDILWLRIEPGSALDEVALAKRFEMSRTPIREAVVMLATDDLVTFLPNRTSIVAPHMLDNMNEYLDSHLLLARSVARQAAHFRTEPDLERMRAAARAYEDALASNDVYAIFGADLALHRAISSGCGNYFSRKFHDISLDTGRRAYVLHYFPAFGAEEKRTSLDEHARLIEAIEARDADASDQAMAQHIGSELKVFKRALDPKIGFDMQVPAPG